MKLRQCAFMVYATSIDQLRRNVRLLELQHVYRVQGTAAEPAYLLKEWTSSLYRVANMDRRQPMCFNEFLFAARKEGSARKYDALVPRAIEYAFRNLDWNKDASASVSDIIKFLIREERRQMGLSGGVFNGAKLVAGKVKFVEGSVLATNELGDDDTNLLGLCADVQLGDGLRVAAIFGGKFMVKRCHPSQGKIKSLRARLEKAQEHLAKMQVEHGNPKGSVEYDGARKAYEEARRKANGTVAAAIAISQAKSRLTGALKKAPRDLRRSLRTVQETRLRLRWTDRAMADYNASLRALEHAAVLHQNSSSRNSTTGSTRQPALRPGFYQCVLQAAPLARLIRDRLRALSAGRLSPATEPGLAITQDDEGPTRGRAASAAQASKRDQLRAKYRSAVVASQHAVTFAPHPKPPLSTPSTPTTFPLVPG